MKPDLKKRLLTAPDLLDAYRALKPHESRTILRLPESAQQTLLEELLDEELIVLLHQLDHDEVTDVLQKMPVTKRKRVFSQLHERVREKVGFLLKFNPTSAAGIMSLDFIMVQPTLTFVQVIAAARKYEQRTGKYPAILAVNKVFCGEVPGSTIAFQPNNVRVEKFLKKIPSISHNTDEKEVIKSFKKTSHNKMVVLDAQKQPIGIIYHDDVLRLIDKHSASSLREFAGVSLEESVRDSALLKVKRRYRWLILNLGTAFLAASVVSMFQETISAYVLLAVYLPIVAGMGGNAGTQTLAVVVRGLALNEVDLRTGKKVVMNEVFAGAINGAINGSIIAVIALLFNQNPLLGFVLGVSMVLNLAIAGFFGALIPLIMKRLNKDPATSATIFITTATDVFGFFIFLSLATMVL